MADEQPSLKFTEAVARGYLVSNSKTISVG